MMLLIIRRPLVTGDLEVLSRYAKRNEFFFNAGPFVFGVQSDFKRAPNAYSLFL